MELNIERFLAVIFCNPTLLSWWFHWPPCFLHSSTALHCTNLRNGFQLPLNDSSVQSIYSNRKHCCDHPGLRWRHVRQGLYGGEVGSILCSNWLPAQTRWSDLAFSGFLTLFLRGKKIFIHIIMWYNFILSFFDQACFVNILASFIFWLISNYLVPWPHTWSIG